MLQKHNSRGKDGRYMKNMNKKLGVIALGAILLMATSTMVYAASAWDSFSVNLPANQGDKEVSKVTRGSSDISHFSILISSIGGGYTAVHAWCETGLGGNVSNPFYQLGVTSPYEWAVPYYDGKSPSMGTNVTLNLDNPVYTSATPSVSGRWTPN